MSRMYFPYKKKNKKNPFLTNFFLEQFYYIRYNSWINTLLNLIQTFNLPSQPFLCDFLKNFTTSGSFHLTLFFKFCNYIIHCNMFSWQRTLILLVSQGIITVILFTVNQLLIAYEKISRGSRGHSLYEYFSLRTRGRLGHERKSSQTSFSEVNREIKSSWIKVGLQYLSPWFIYRILQFVQVWDLLYWPPPFSILDTFPLRSPEVLSFSYRTTVSGSRLLGLWCGLQQCLNFGTIHCSRLELKYIRTM